MGDAPRAARGETKVSKLAVVAEVEENVLRLEIAMNYSLQTTRDSPR